MIEMHDGQHAGISALAIEMKLDIDTLKGMLQSLRYQAARPFIEVADNQTRMLQLRREQDFTAHQQPRLFSPLHISSAQMNVEEMDNLSRRDFQITANAA